MRDERRSRGSFFVVRTNQDVNDARRGLPVPLPWRAVLPLPAYLTADSILDGICFCPRNRVCPALDGNRSFGVFSDGDAGGPQNCCFFLDAARVGHDERCVLHQTKEVHIAEGIGQDYFVATVSRISCIFLVFPCSCP